MANPHHSDAQREALLRRVAIVLSSLPPATAAELLGSIDPQSKQAVRRTMTKLSDVDPLERQRALKAFKVSIQSQPMRASGSASRDEVSLGGSRTTSSVGSRVVPGVAVGEESPQHSVASTTALSFLADVDDDTLVGLLVKEHPQAIALVLASIAPVQAARVLPRLDPRTQSDALSRIGRLGEIPEAAVAELAKHFQQQVQQRSGGTGQRALSAILAALPTAPAPPPVADHRSYAASYAAPEAVSQPVLHTRAETTEVRPLTFPSLDTPAVDLTHKLRVAEGTWPESVPQPVPSTTPMNPPALIAAEQVDVLSSTDSIHQHLINLPPLELCQALGKVETRVAMLTLCGLPNEVAESILAVLPRGQAKKVRIKMTTLGSLHLREIDDAKEVVARMTLSAGERTDAEYQVPVAA
jgi:flagellar motor switch protein FliG